MKEKKRAERRREKAKRKKWAREESYNGKAIMNSDNLSDDQKERMIGLIAKSPKTTSTCRCCINPRKVDGNLTRQEIEADLKLEEGKKEIEV